MTIHMGDDISRIGARYDGAWPRPSTKTTPRPIPATNHPEQRQEPNWNQATSDATNMSMYEHGLIQPEDL
jgi:hypothetical protein